MACIQKKSLFLHKKAVHIFVSICAPYMFETVSMQRHGTALRAWHMLSIMIVLSPKLVPALLS